MATILSSMARSAADCLYPTDYHPQWHTAAPIGHYPTGLVPLAWREFPASRCFARSLEEERQPVTYWGYMAKCYGGHTVLDRSCHKFL